MAMIEDSKYLAGQLKMTRKKTNSSEKKGRQEKLKKKYKKFEIFTIPSYFTAIFNFT